jgi:hypothetical protein
VPDRPALADGPAVGSPRGVLGDLVVDVLAAELLPVDELAAIRGAVSGAAANWREIARALALVVPVAAR